MKRFLLFVVASLLAVACDNKFEDVSNSRQSKVDMPTLTASFEEDTRTYVEDNLYLRWHEGDLISAFLGNTLNNKYIFKGDTGDNGGTFSAVSSTELGSSYPLDNIFAIYPYDENIEISKTGTISCSLPAVQEYAEESFGKGANTMVAVTKSTDDTFLAFKNACGYLKIKLYGKATVKSIELKGNNGEKIAGKATISAEYGAVPQVVMAEDATESITLDCVEGVKLSADAENPTEFWFVVPAVEFSKGLTIVATDIYGTTFEKSTANAVTITRNEIQPMAALEAIFRDPNKPAYNEIWYTSSDGEIIEPYSGQYNDYADALTTFGANIVSNNYKDGKGVITFDGDVTTIGEWAFYWCFGLTSVTIPDSVTTIGNYAFRSCIRLTSVYCKATTPPSLGSNAFKYYSYGSYINIGCTIYVPRGCDSAYKSASYWKDYAADIVEYDFDKGEVIPEGQSNNKIWYTSSDGKIVEPYSGPYNDYADALTTFGANIVSNNYKDGKGIITFDGDVTMIGYSAFYCGSLTSVTIPDSVTTIGSNAFYGCNSLKEFKGKFAADNGRCLIVDGVLNSFAIGCGATKYTIPDSVTTIGDAAFAYCSSLTSVTIPDSVTTIGNYAFYGCYSLTSVTIPDSVTTIGDAAFEDCYSLTSVTIPDSVTTIRTEAFAYCSSLTSVTIPDSVTTIGDAAFLYCTSLTSVTIPDSVTTIGNYAFYNCSSLTSVTIPNSVTTIGNYAFRSCTSLTTVTIPDSVTTIGNYAFRSCTRLTSVTIGDSVTTIGEWAFAYCTSLTSVYCKATIPPSLGSSAFYDNHSGRKIYVPRGCGEAYKSAATWSDYAAHIVEYDF